MKFFFSILIMLAFCTSAFSAGNSSKSFPLYSSASAGVKTSAVYDVSGYKVKTLTVSGATLNSNNSATTFKNMSGTAIVECGGTKSGPWATCVANDYAQTAVSRTTNGQMTWTDASPFVRFKWTASTVGTKLKAFLNWTE